MGTTRLGPVRTRLRRWHGHSTRLGAGAEAAVAIIGGAAAIIAGAVKLLEAVSPEEPAEPQPESSS